MLIRVELLVSPPDNSSGGMVPERLFISNHATIVDRLLERTLQGLGRRRSGREPKMPGFLLISTSRAPKDVTLLKSRGGMVPTSKLDPTSRVREPKGARSTWGISSSETSPLKRLL